MANVKVSLRGEHLCSGQSAYAPYMFWHAVKLDEIHDWGTVTERLRAIHAESGIQHELRVSSRTIAFAPAFTVEIDDSFALSR